MSVQYRDNFICKDYSPPYFACAESTPPAPSIPSCRFFRGLGVRAATFILPYHRPVRSRAEQFPFKDPRRAPKYCDSSIKTKSEATNPQYPSKATKSLYFVQHIQYRTVPCRRMHTARRCYDKTVASTGIAPICVHMHVYEHYIYSTATLFYFGSQLWHIDL